MEDFFTSQAFAIIMIALAFVGIFMLPKLGNLFGKILARILGLDK